MKKPRRPSFTSSSEASELSSGEESNSSGGEERPILRPTTTLEAKVKPVNVPQRALKLIMRMMWILVGAYVVRDLCRGGALVPVWRPLWLQIATGAYLLLASVGVAAAAYLRLRMQGAGKVPFRRWRVHIPSAVYAMSTLQVFGFASLVLAFGVSVRGFLAACVLNLSALSLLSFVR